MEKRNLHTLDALRGVAAISVVIQHYADSFQPIPLGNNYLAVDLFFIMSGVVIARAYDERLASGLTNNRFMAIRLVRLYPLYMLGSVIALATALASMAGRGQLGWTPTTLSQAFGAALLFLPAGFVVPDRGLFPLNRPAWSLFFELIVNSAHGLTWRLQTTSRLLAAVILSGFVLAVQAIDGNDLDVGATADLRNLVVGLARALFGFCVGLLIGRHAPRQVMIRSDLAVLALLALVLTMLMLAPTGVPVGLWALACIVAVFPPIVLAATIIEPSKRLASAALFAGVISYAIYIVHYPAIHLFRSVLNRLYPGAIEANAPWIGFGQLAVLIVACWLLDRAYDKPVHRKLAALLEPRLNPVHIGRKSVCTLPREGGTRPEVSESQRHHRT